MAQNEARRRRMKRIRKKVVGTPVKPRLSVYKSSKHIYAQLIDDVRDETLTAVSSLDEEITDERLSGIDLARRVGELLGERALENGLSEAVFDRSGYKYHGKIAALADGARKAGLNF